MSSSLVRLTLYGLIVAIDIDLRTLVREQLNDSRAINEIFDPELLEKTLARAKRDGRMEGSDVYDYLDFPDAIQTLRRHKGELDTSTARFLEKNSTELDRLTPIRNRVMHGRPLQFTDYSTVDTFVQKLLSYPSRMFPNVFEFESRVRDNPNFVYSLDLSRVGAPSDRIPHNLPLPDYDETGFL
ncbi:hypothetical protein, partial [Sphingomonas sp.]|uniref:hypothetical protein n=1 Tax=Sphingomonas sp. TaxID=28214 RepID=UPI003B3B849C